MISQKSPDEMDPVNQHWYINLMDRFNALSLLVESIKSSIVTRADIEAADRLRVLNDTYQSDMRGLHERLTRMEAGPGRFIAWAGLAVASAGCLVSLFVATFTGLGVAFSVIWSLSHH